MLKTKTRNPAETQRRLIDAAVRLMLCQGFAATTVDQICAEAGLTKGSFFHYFDSKEAIGRAAMDAFARVGMELYSAAWKDPQADPLEQLYALLEIMMGFTRQSGDPVTCMVGMLSQEMARTNRSMREAAVGHLTAWTEMVMRMLAEAKKKHPPKIDFDPERVAWMLNSLWQGSMLIAKTRQTPEMIVENLQQARAYVDSLFTGVPGRSPLPKTQAKFRTPAQSKKTKERNPS
ncbi:MAG: TetR/AcrR family transcriptional regulator [Verrucomicrobiota bacterium]|nr:TetR/AcrR family transcriptional regulator [Verrucomicrobiota bacterium]